MHHGFLYLRNNLNRLCIFLIVVFNTSLLVQVDSTAVKKLKSDTATTSEQDDFQLTGLEKAE